MIDKIHLPYRNADDPFDLAQISDDIDEAIADPTERRVQREVAYSLLTGNAPETIGEAVELLERATPKSRRDLLDRARQRAGLPTLTAEQAKAPPEPFVTSRPARDGQGRIDAICAEPTCRNFEPGESSQFRKVDCRRWWCPEHRAGHEADLEPWQGPNYGYNAAGLYVDLDEQAIEKAKAIEEERHRAAEAEARRAERAVDAEALSGFEEAKRERDRSENRHQTGLAA